MPTRPGLRPGISAPTLNKLADGEITAETQRLVEVLIAGGCTQKTVATAMGVSPKFLRRNYRQQITNGQENANAWVISRLHDQIVRGSNAAIIFWLKARAGWKEGSVVTVRPELDGDEDSRAALAEMTPKERTQLRELLMKANRIEEE